MVSYGKKFIVLVSSKTLELMKSKYESEKTEVAEWPQVHNPKCHGKKA